MDIYTLIYTFVSYKYPRKSQSRNYIWQNACNHVVQPTRRRCSACTIPCKWALLPPRLWLALSPTAALPLSDVGMEALLAGWLDLEAELRILDLLSKIITFPTSITPCQVCWDSAWASVVHLISITALEGTCCCHALKGIWRRGRQSS